MFSLTSYVYIFTIPLLLALYNSLSSFWNSFNNPFYSDVSIKNFLSVFYVSSNVISCFKIAGMWEALNYAMTGTTSRYFWHCKELYIFFLGKNHTYEFWQSWFYVHSVFNSHGVGKLISVLLFCQNNPPLLQYVCNIRLWLYLHYIWNSKGYYYDLTFNASSLDMYPYVAILSGDCCSAKLRI